MFENISNFGFERTGKQAFGFYLAYLFLGIILGMLIGGIYGAIAGGPSFENGVHAGQIVAIFYCLGLGITVAHSKGLFPSFKVMFLVLLSGLLAVFIGAIGGLIPIAYISTMRNSHNKDHDDDTGNSVDF